MCYCMHEPHRPQLACLQYENNGSIAWSMLFKKYTRGWLWRNYETPDDIRVLTSTFEYCDVWVFFQPITILGLTLSESWNPVWRHAQSTLYPILLSPNTNTNHNWLHSIPTEGPPTRRPSPGEQLSSCSHFMFAFVCTWSSFGICTLHSFSTWRLLGTSATFVVTKAKRSS
jgi:hypothetical protein